MTTTMMQRRGKESTGNDSQAEDEGESQEIRYQQEIEDDSDDYKTEDEEEDDDKDTDGSKQVVLWEDWKQHLLAMLVAVLAAALGYTHLGTAETLQTSSLLQSVPSLTPSNRPNNRLNNKHSHLHSYKRMDNVSFCEAAPPRDLSSLSSLEDSALIPMDFYISEELVYVLERHYVADVLEDDDYQLLDMDDDDAKVFSHGIPHQQLQDIAEYQCLRAQVAKNSNHPRTKIQGSTLVYKQPSLQSMMIMMHQQPDGDNGANQAPVVPGVLHHHSSKIKKHSKQKQRGDAIQPVALSHTGFAAKFVNLSPRAILLHWDGRGGHEASARAVAQIDPFQSVATATTPGQSFYVSPLHDKSHALQRWTVTADEAVLYYEPSSSSSGGGGTLSEKLSSSRDQFLYDLQRLNRQYATAYLASTQRAWLAHFPRPRPMHRMRAGDFFGQQHEIMTGAVQHHQPQQSQQHNNNVESNNTLKLTLEVVSVAPRVFVMEDFLSPFECQYLIDLAAQNNTSFRLQPSTVVSGGAASQRHMHTRSSTNAWIPRETSDITDAIYRRAADALGMDEALLRHRSDEHLDIATHHSVAESLQLVRYRRGQEYTAHHDWIVPSSSTNRYQPTRFATLLLYLNDHNLTGGETVFPRAVNHQYHDGITVTPKRGRAVLFYNMLEDGNVDDLSLHASKPVVQGTKWLANLWVWDPIID